MILGLAVLIAAASMEMDLVLVALIIVDLIPLIPLTLMDSILLHLIHLSTEGLFRLDIHLILLVLEIDLAHSALTLFRM